VSLGFPVSLDDLARKVMAIHSFLPGAKPRPSTGDEDVISDDLCFRMELHKDILRGTGFYSTMTQVPDISPSMGRMSLEGPSIPLRALPSFNFLEIGDQVLRSGLLQVPLPDDRARFEQYASNRPLGIALVAAPVSELLIFFASFDESLIIRIVRAAPARRHRS
jgi:hypothetical protein